MFESAGRGTRRQKRRLALLLAALAAGNSYGAPCAQGLITMPGAVARLELCDTVQQQVPQLLVLVEQLLKAAARSEERSRDVERLLRNVNAAAMRIEARQNVLARSFADKLAEVNNQPEAAAARQIRRLSDDLEQANERLASTAADPRHAEATAAVKAAIVDALAALDLDKVGRLLDSLGSIEKKVDVITQTTDESRNVAIFSEATRTRARGDQGQVKVLAAFVQQGKNFDGQDFAGVGFPAVTAPGLRAGAAVFSFSQLRGADLSQADLRDAQLVGVDLEGSSLAGAKLAKARGFLAAAKKVNLQQADLSLSSWVAADLRGADLRNAKLNGASFANADLSDADLSGADLSGAFFGNASLRGAKFDEAIFKNTDVAGAYLSLIGLTAGQISGLCATSPMAVHSWRVVERIPSTRFGSGFEFLDIFLATSRTAQTGHRPYPRCQIRGKGDLTEWNRPIRAEGKLEAWSSDLSFRVEHAVMESSGRRRELLERLELAVAAADSRPSTLIELPQFAAERKALENRLDERLRDLTVRLAPAAQLMFDDDTALLMILRLRPSLLKRLSFDWASASKYRGNSDILGANSKAKPWPRLFPEELRDEDLSEVTTRRFEKWTLARSKSLPDNAVLLGSQGAQSDIAGWGEVLAYSTWGAKAGTDRDLEKQLGVGPERLAVFRGRGLGYTDRNVWTAFKFETDTLASREAIARANAPGVGVLPVIVKDVDIVATVSGEQYTVWTLSIKP